ncbi:MAG TPA: prepilin peptidase [Anaerolineae bacterium]|nr:prepilin peptidase [Anaerolineae bacterium]
MCVHLLIRMLAVSALALVAYIDWQRHEIWHFITIPSIVGAVFFADWLPAHFRANALLGSLIALIFFGLIWLVARHVYGIGALGFGDVMLAALVGAIGGVVSGLLWLAVGMLLAGGYAAWLRFILKSATGVIPYGSFIALSSVIGIIVSKI